MGPVVCSLGSIDAGGTASITVILQASSTPGARQNGVTMTAAESDTNGQDNAATVPFTTAAALAEAVPALSGWVLLLLVATLTAIAVGRTLRG